MDLKTQEEKKHANSVMARMQDQTPKSYLTKNEEFEALKKNLKNKFNLKKCLNNEDNCEVFDMHDN